MLLNMPCIKCGVINNLEVEDSEQVIFVCPSCHIGTALIDGDIYNFRKEFMEVLLKKHGLQVSGDIVGTNHSDRFSGVKMRLKGSKALQKGAQLTEDYLSNLHKSLESAKTLEEVLESIEYPDKE